MRDGLAAAAAAEGAFALRYRLLSSGWLDVRWSIAASERIGGWAYVCLSILFRRCVDFREISFPLAAGARFYRRQAGRQAVVSLMDDMYRGGWVVFVSHETQVRPIMATATWRLEPK